MDPEYVLTAHSAVGVTAYSTQAVAYGAVIPAPGSLRPVMAMTACVGSSKYVSAAYQSYGLTICLFQCMMLYDVGACVTANHTLNDVSKTNDVGTTVLAEPVNTCAAGSMYVAGNPDASLPVAAALYCENGA